ncbi:myosin-VIIa-like isoform X1 [Oculina patagonica]
MELNGKQNIQEPDNLSSFDFSSFAKSNFQNGEHFQFTRVPLMSSLLSSDKVEDRKAACAISVAILRFMRDMPEPKLDEEDNEISEITEITRPSNKAYTSGTTFKRKVVTEKAQDISLTSHDVPPLVIMNRPTTNVEKVQFITSFGIRRPALRDEIYCQICRQLVNNSSQTSYARGWILLALCVGVFPPSDQLLNYVRNFLKVGPGEFGDYCSKILQRTLQVGCRRQPPTTIEIEAVKTQSSLNLPVIFMDGTTKTFEVDPAVTCAELCQLIKNKLGLRDIFGFSIFIEALNQVSNWGCGKESVLDAVSLAEQYACSKKLSDPNDWHLFFRKDLFAPTDNLSSDNVAIDLIYHQILGGIRVEEYICEHQEMINIVAKRYYIEYGQEIKENMLRRVIQDSFPPFVLTSIAEDELVKNVKASFNASSRVQERSHSQVVKQDIVRYAATNWLKEFSRIFDGYVSSGPKLPKAAVRLAFNSQGLMVFSSGNLDAPPLLGLAYSQIKKASSLRKGMYLDAVLVVNTSRSSTYTFRSPHADDMDNLINHFLKYFNSPNTAGADD